MSIQNSNTHSLHSRFLFKILSLSVNVFYPSVTGDSEGYKGLAVLCPKSIATLRMSLGVHSAPSFVKKKKKERKKEKKRKKEKATVKSRYLLYTPHQM